VDPQWQFSPLTGNVKTQSLSPATCINPLAIIDNLGLGVGNDILKV